MVRLMGAILLIFILSFASAKIYANCSDGGCPAFTEACTNADNAKKAAEDGKTATFKDFANNCFMEKSVVYECIYSPGLCNVRILNTSNTVPPEDCSKISCYIQGVTATFVNTGECFDILNINDQLRSKDRSEKCINLCKVHWDFDKAIQTAIETKATVEATQAQICAQTTAACAGLTGDALNKCVCESQGGTWNNGECGTGGIGLGNYSNNNSTGTASDNNSSGQTASTVSSGAGTGAGLGAGGAASMFGASKKASSGDKKGAAGTWYDKVLGSMGMNYSGAGGRFSSSEDKYGISGGGATNGKDKKKAAADISDEDLWTQIHNTYTNRSLSGLLGTTDLSSSSSVKKPINKIGTKSPIYRNKNM